MGCSDEDAASSRAPLCCTMPCCVGLWAHWTDSGLATPCRGVKKTSGTLVPGKRSPEFAWSQSPALANCSWLAQIRPHHHLQPGVNE